jgi:type I restriction enzyme S subunit
MVSRDWITVPLGEVVTLQRGYDLPNRWRRPGAVPIVTSSGIGGTHNEAMVSGPGVVTGRYGTIGKVFYIESDFWPLNKEDEDGCATRVSAQRASLSGL